MTTRHYEQADPHDPVGSIFLPESKNNELYSGRTQKLFEKFLSLQGEPAEILSQLEEESPHLITQIHSTLQFCLLQSRGGIGKIEEALSDTAMEEEINMRAMFYEAIEANQRKREEARNALGRLALQ